jgi:hypothetical protein
MIQQLLRRLHVSLNGLRLQAGHGQNFKIAETIGHKLSDVINTVGSGDK